MSSSSSLLTFVLVLAEFIPLICLCKNSIRNQHIAFRIRFDYIGYILKFFTALRMWAGLKNGKRAFLSSVSLVQTFRLRVHTSILTLISSIRWRKKRRRISIINLIQPFKFQNVCPWNCYIAVVSWHLWMLFSKIQEIF